METLLATRRLGALAQVSRLAIFRLLVVEGPAGLPAGEIAARLSLSAATLSFHLKSLAHAGLIAARQDGRFIFYSADFAAMNDLLGFLTANCCGGKPCEVQTKPAAVPGNIPVTRRSRP